jgi:hypothetical protein
VKAEGGEQKPVVSGPQSKNGFEQEAAEEAEVFFSAGLRYLRLLLLKTGRFNR